ncbi:MAG: PQQ-dependent sugar dehydrogenase [Candidatus Anammoxibacter sp.]
MKNKILNVSIICLIINIGCLYKLYGEAMVALEEIVNGITEPVQVTNAGDGSLRLFIVEQDGRIVIFKNNELLPVPFLDIEFKVSGGGEEGLLSVAFHPDFNNNRRFFVNYTTLLISGQIKTVVAEYHASTDNPDIADQGERIILEIEQPFRNHNGGQLQFGPDGFLYIDMGDGGGSGDPSGNGQNKNTLLGALLRIDIDSGDPFSIPPDNPFIGRDGADEIWAYGLRNPWRFSFDRTGERLFLADVGQSDFEEVDLIEKGGNYGWNIMEGSHCFSQDNSDCDRADLILPISEYSHDNGSFFSSITGGYVYRGSEIPDLFGRYIFGDFFRSTIWSLTETDNDTWERTELLQTTLSISSFGEDEAGELYVVDHSGTVFKIVPVPDGDGGNDNRDKSFTFKCGQELNSAIGGLEKLILQLGDNEVCTVTLTHPEPGKLVEVLTKRRSWFGSSVEIDPVNGIADSNGELKFTINASKRGINWVAWAVPDKQGNVRFNKKAYDSGAAWGMFVEVR